MSYYEKTTYTTPPTRSKYRLYVGNISHRCHPSDVEELFGDYGELTDFDFKDRGQQVNFCFVEYRSSRDSEDAMYELNGHRLLGVPIIVEPARERRPREQFINRTNTKYYDNNSIIGSGEYGGSSSTYNNNSRSYKSYVGSGSGGRSMRSSRAYMDGSGSGNVSGTGGGGRHRVRYVSPSFDGGRHRGRHIHHHHHHHQRRRSRSRSYSSRGYGGRGGRMMRGDGGGRMYGRGRVVVDRRHHRRHRHVSESDGERQFSEHSVVVEDGENVDGKRKSDVSGSGIVHEERLALVPNDVEIMNDMESKSVDGNVDGDLSVVNENENENEQ